MTSLICYPVAQGYLRFSNRVTGRKLYCALLCCMGKVSNSRRSFRRATEAKEYSERLVARYLKLHKESPKWQQETISTRLK